MKELLIYNLPLIRVLIIKTNRKLVREFKIR